MTWWTTALSRLHAGMLLVALVASFVLLLSCKKDEQLVGDVVKGAPLVVAIVNGPTTYFEDAQSQPTGYEFDLASAFAQDIGVEVRFVTVTTQQDAINLVKEQRAHMAAGGFITREKPLTPPTKRSAPKTTHAAAKPIADAANKPPESVKPAPRYEVDGKLLGPAFHNASSILIYRKRESKPPPLNEMTEASIAVIAGSEADQTLSDQDGLDQTAADGFKLTRLPSGSSAADLLSQLTDAAFDYALIDSTTFDASKQLFPQIEKAYDVGQTYHYAWAYGKTSRDFLLRHSDTFFAKLGQSGLYKRLIDKHFGLTQRLSAVDLATFVERVQSTLPKYRQMFLDAAEISGIDWKLLAAIGYQESHWNPLATSPTGVRGLMMLTSDTADRMKVTDRTDAKQSIFGGARYFAMMRDGLPLRISEPDRTWLALAAYNQGLGNLESARILTTRSGRSADLWENVSKELPKLSDPSVYSTLKTGYARGSEAVHFATNVRAYYDVLTKIEARAAAVRPSS
jgi:membrane-bound lytic murein transglycosylase F